ncbi:MAG TPA: carboxypeptidase regulatory-like domain-containing protein [Micropepsaceae bacterium]|nr:carboxypeptidase regulatory-like domain-containing protein [Micropepsaceae bacterium]
MVFTNWLKSGIAICALAVALPAAAAVPDAGAIKGMVKDAAGKPVAGAFVKLRNNERRLTFMVISKDGGRFEAKDLPAGHYTAEGVGAEGESKISTPVAVKSGALADVTVALVEKRGPSLPAAWPDRLPEAQIPKPADIKLPDGPGKELVQAKCNVCHDSARIVSTRTTAKNWEHTVWSMRQNMAAANIPDLSDGEAATIQAYLVKNFPSVVPYNENNRLPRTAIEGKARDYRVVTFRLEPEFAEPHDIAVDPTGIAWAAKRGGQNLAGGKLIRFDPHTLEITEVNAPTGSAPPSRRRLGNPQIGPDGVLWTADAPNKRWLSFDTTTRKFINYFVPDGHLAGGNSMALDHATGMVWSSDQRNGIYSLNPKTGEWKFYRAPTKNSGAYGIALSGDGSPWFAEDNIDRIGHLDLKTGKVEELPIKDQGEKILPRRMNSDADGNIWVGLWDAGKLMKIDYKTKKMSIFTPPTRDAGCYSVTVDKKNNIVWVSEQEVDKIGRFDPKTNTWMEFALPDSQSDPRRIELDPTDPNRVFFSGNSANLIGFIEYTPENDVHS